MCLSNPAKDFLTEKATVLIRVELNPEMLESCPDWDARLLV